MGANHFVFDAMVVQVEHVFERTDLHCSQVLHSEHIIWVPLEAETLQRVRSHAIENEAIFLEHRIVEQVVDLFVVQLQKAYGKADFTRGTQRFNSFAHVLRCSLHYPELIFAR